MANRQKTKKNRARPNPEKLQEETVQEVELGQLVRDERAHKILGAFLILMSFFLFVAFTSYLFTWKQDQDKVLNHGISILMPNKLEIENQLGSFGAYVSHVFMYEGFGIASFLLCLLFLATGSNLLTGRRIFRLLSTFINVAFGLILLSTLFAFIMSGASFHWGGDLGQVMSTWLSGFLGKLGTVMLLFAAVLSFIIWRFNPVFRMPAIRPVKRDEVSPAAPAAADIDGGEPEPGPEENLSAGPSGNTLKSEGAVLVQLTEEESPEEPEFTLVEREPEPKPVKRERPVVSVIPPADPELPVETPVISGLPADDGLELQIKPTVGVEGTEEEKPAAKVLNLPPYDPVLDLRDYEYPDLELLEQYPGEKIVMDQAELEANKNQIINTLKNYDIAIQRIFATVGPTVTLYEIVPAAGVRISRIKNLEDDIALSLSALGIRIIAPIPGKGTIGIEVPNVKKSVVGMKTLLASDKFQHSKFSLPVAIGKRIDNELFIVDLTTMPHLLMAGATGQGKSVGINALLVSLLYKKHPSQLKFVLVDPKKVELSLYKTIENHFLAKLPGEEDAIITDTKKVVHTLNALCIEMDNRYDLLKEAGCRNIREYNEKFVARKLNPEKGHQYLPFIVLVIDEFADLIMTAGKEIEMPIGRLAQLARAVGIHLIIATQRPSVNIITGTIKANFPARIAFKVSSKIDSRTILDVGGAEQLIGRGDMLISYMGEITRLQCVLVDTPEVERVVESIGRQRGYAHAFLLPEYIDEKELEGKDFDMQNRDPLFAEAARLIVQQQTGSTSLLQRRMKLGYNRAGRLMDQLEAAGIVGSNQGSKVREVLYKSEVELEQYLDTLD
jgi:S-DNA-T family DNA segregation ATPase FtsK/SpoIIIE